MHITASVKEKDLCQLWEELGLINEYDSTHSNYYNILQKESKFTPNVRAIDDVDTQKKWIDENIISAFTEKKYVGRKNTLSFENVKIKPREYTLADQKKAIMSKRSLSRPVSANMILTENETGKILDRTTNTTIAMAPYHTGRNSIISGGVYYVPTNQIRLRPGAYTRKKANDEIETHFNLKSGTGSGLRINMEPQTGIFGMRLGTSNIKLYPLLEAMGVSDEKLKSIWGKDILDINKRRSGGQKDILKIYEKLLPFSSPNVDSDKKVEAIVESLNKATMEPEINEVTLGNPHLHLTSDAILDSTKKIIKVSRGEQQEDDRDSLQFKKIYSIEDFYKEKIMKDAGGLGKNLVIRKLDRRPDLTLIPPSYFTKQLWGAIKGDPTISPKGTLTQPIEEINPLDIYDQHHKISILGEGGIGDSHVISLEARNVHPSQFGFVDHIRTPESVNVGVDQRLALGTHKGRDNIIYKQFINSKTGKKEWLNPLDAITKIISFPGRASDKGKTIDAMKRGKVEEVPKKEIEYYLEHPNELYSTYNNLIPMPQAVQGNRMILAGKAISTSMPLVNPEAPLVLSKNPLTGNSFEQDLGHKILAKTSKVDGVIHSISKDNIFIKDPTGKTHRHGLFNNFPLNLKTLITNKIKVNRGQKVKKGDLIASSNFTDKHGVLANGMNLRSAYMPYRGWNFEDGIVISDSASKRLTSEQVYTYDYKIDDPDAQVVDKNKYRSIYPTLINRDQADMVDNDGIIKKGIKIKAGDPIILSMEKRVPSAKDIQLGNLHRALKNRFTNTAATWEHHSDGEVIDVYKDKKYVKVLVKTLTPAKVGDKLTGRFGNKGVIGKVVSDEQMPFVKNTNKKIEIILNPLGIPSRINPAQMHEAMLGKIVRKTNKPYILQSFDHDDLKKFTDKELEKNKISKDDTIVFPDDEKEIENVFNGVSYIWKLSKLSEGEIKKREIAGFDINEQPIKGKSIGGQAMRIGNMEINALLGHGAKYNLQEMSTIKGQKNDEFWRALKLGLPLPTPRTPFVYEKFMKMLEASGINVNKRGEYIQILPMTDRDILKKSSGEIIKPELLYSKNLMPIKQGLFDPGITGGTMGNRWSHITLTEALPNPIMEEPIKKILGINKFEFNNLIKENKLGKAIQNINLNVEIENIKKDISFGRESQKNLSIKKLGYLQTLKDNNLTLKDMMLKHAPVLPPIFRPVSAVGTKGSISPGGANLLYKDLITSNSALQALKKEFPDDEVKNERELNYKALKAVVGLGKPINIKNENKKAKGFIAEIVGDQPKTGFFQRRVISKTQDLVGRAVATPDPTLNMDQIGIPEKIAWKQFKPFVMRKMIGNGVSPLQADKEIQEQSERATRSLLAEMKERPVIVNRNPSLHKYNIMALEGILHSGDTIKMCPSIAPGFNLDHDGDQLNLYVPVTPEAVREAKNILLPSKNLLHLQDRKVHYTPIQESLYGAFSLTRPPKDKRVVKKYRNIMELKLDLKRGKIKATDVVELKR